ncbi:MULTISPECIES: cation acetate symporter [unclassified Streptomyces]|uniref:sodium/solute symporter n=1 Tax=unclassified Streptomyces TaxID=2593676 RepID=UPI002DD90C17|nr:MULTISPECIES: cation acetate symporter [unclassified Streptomyces]WSC37443.1 cation acetate symporter [Streptomyces sp. NBC_01763]WSC45567.1 cation acetate symporter [Streptomyces sp. NBC_01762]WSC55452.1 cation acetate symporter [Streptomyces sp. NBC_01761]WSF86287.1 cation acetate symporter [Streptomyces sp. NBC_01744]
MNGFDESAQTMSLVAFIAVATVTLLLCVMTGPDRDDLDEFYTGYRSLSPVRNGLAIAGDYLSAATLFGTTGVIALTGYDGLVLALSTALSLVLLMFLLAEPLRNAGRFTMGDMLTRRAPGRAVRIAACGVTLTALVPLMVVQLAGSGDLLAFILGFDSSGFRTGSIIVLGIVMISYAAIGGMKGTALIQIVKTVVLVAACLTISALVMNRFDWSTGALLAAAQRGSGAGAAYLHSGLQFGGSGLDMVSSQLTVVLGAACLPHITMRMSSARSAQAVRRSLSWAVSVVVGLCLLLTVIGFGAAALVGHNLIVAAGAQGNGSILQVSGAVAGTGELGALVVTMMTTAIFLTLLASVAGMILACANSLAHDLFAHGLHGIRDRDKEPVEDRIEMGTAQAAAVGVGLVAITLAVLARHWNVQALVTLSFCIGASALAPALVYSMFWRRFTRTGLLSTLIGGTVVVLVLITGTNLVSGSPGSVFPGRDFNWFPFTTTGLVSIPAGFLAGWLGTVLGGHTAAEERRLYEAEEPWILAGAPPATARRAG